MDSKNDAGMMYGDGEPQCKDEAVACKDKVGRGGQVMTWEERTKALWELLDDIDGAGDVYKPERNHYFKYVCKKVARRFQYLESDGYELYLPGERNSEFSGIELIKDR